MRTSRIATLMVLFLLAFSIAGVYATWIYYDAMEPVSDSVKANLREFQYGPPEAVYISAVEVVTSSSSISNTVQTPSMPTYLIASANVGSSNSSITYKITVFNNTDVTYWYLGAASASSSLPSNALVGSADGIRITTKDKLQDSSETFNTADWIPPRTERVFYAIYTFGGNALGEIATMIDFRFGVHMDSVYDGFLRILNDKISDNGYYYLSEVFDTKYAQTQSTVIANVGAEEDIFDRLFGGPLHVDVDGNQIPVTVMIQRKNVDRTANGDSYSVPGGPTGCEYSIYISVPSQTAGGTATVYAVSYTCRSDGVWYQIGQLYEGTAPVTDYGGVEDGAFNVDGWRASPNEYDLGYGLNYKAGYEQGDQFEKMKTLEELMSAQDSSFGNKINGNPLFKNVYQIVKSNPNSEAPEIVNLRRAWDAIEPYFVIYNDGGTIWFDGNRWTRSEILPYLVHLCDAYEYYLQVNE